MLLDISGNTFSSLGNTAPSIIYQPQQIFGTGLTIWYDFNDTSTLFSDSGATTNVQNTGDYILYVKNKAIDRPNHDLRQSIPSNTPLSSFTSSTSSVFRLNKSALNTNKNSNFFIHNSVLTSAPYALAGISGYSTTGKSALTWSGVFRVLTANTAYVSASFQTNLFAIRFTNSNNIRITIGFTPSITTIATFNTNLTKSNGHFCCTITLDQNKNGVIYFNEQKITTNQLSGTTYPLLASSNFFIPFFVQGTSFTTRSNSLSSLVEFCFNDSEVLTDNQVLQLHQYYRTKYNLPFS